MAGNTPPPSGEKKTGWVKVFECPSCGSKVTLRAVGMTMSAVCSSCRSIIDTNNENYKVISKAAKVGRRAQVIPLGQRGKLHGTLWENIGYMERSDHSGEYTWSEYLLFNPLKGFRWLTEFDGHWNYILTTKSKPIRNSNLGGGYGREYVRYLDKFYYLFLRGSATVGYVIGEFYWQVKNGERVKVEDYVAPPEILSLEKSNSEEVWSIGEYIDANDIKTAFQIDVPMPAQLGVAPNQPCTTSNSSKECGKQWFQLIMALCVVQFLVLVLAKSEPVYTQEFIKSSSNYKLDTTPFASSFYSNSGSPEVTAPFELKHGVKNVEIKLFSNVNNGWVEVQGELVNDDTGESIDFNQGVEYYSGYDSDGSWTEGSKYNSVVLSSVPSGKYHLNVESSSDVESGSFTLTVKRDVVTWSNFLWAFLLLSLIPLVLWWRSWRFELSRWSQSDFSPHFLHQESE